MYQNYTRQRQGRDFPPDNYLRNAEMSAESNFNNIDGILGNGDAKDDSERKKSLIAQLEQCKAKAEQGDVPVDGHEPPEHVR